MDWRRRGCWLDGDVGDVGGEIVNIYEWSFDGKSFNGKRDRYGAGSWV